MGHLFGFAARFLSFLETGAALIERKPHTFESGAGPRRFKRLAVGIAGLLAIVALSLVAVSPGTVGNGDNVSLAHTPACPSSLPTEDGESFWTDSNDDRWYIIRKTADSGYTTVQAYVASTAYDSGYVPSSPHETCVLKVRGPGDTADLDPPVQIFFPNDDDDDSSSTGTTQTPDPSTTISVSEVPDDSDDTGLATIGLAWFAYYGTELTIAVALTDLTADSDADTVDYHFRVVVKQGTIIDELCQGSGMNDILELKTNTGSSIQTATVPGTCPVGTYTIEVTLGAGDDADLSDPISEATGFLVIGAQPGSQFGQGGNGGNGGGNGGNGGGNGGNGGGNGGNGGGNGGNSGGGNGGNSGGGNGGNSGGGNGGNSGGGNGGNSGGGNGGNSGGGNGGNSGGGNGGNSGGGNGGNSGGGNGGNSGGGNGGNSGGGNGGNSGGGNGGNSGGGNGGNSGGGNGGNSNGGNGGNSGGGNGGNSNGGNNNGGGNNNIQTVNTVVLSDCGDAARGSNGTPGTPTVPTLVLTQDTTMAGVSWTAPSDNGSAIMGYSIMVTPQGGTATQHDAGGLSEIISGLTAGTTYEFNVSACNAVGFGPWSPGKLLITAPTAGTSGGNTVGDTNNWCGIALAGSSGTPDAPSTPTVTGTTDTSITVTWTAPEDDGGSQIKMYAVQWTPAGGSAQMEKVMSTTTFTHTIRNLASGSVHLIQVAACNVVGMSEWSTAANDQTTGTRQNPQPTEDPNEGNNDQGTESENDPNGNGGTNTEVGEVDPNDYRPIVSRRCGSGEWDGHNHTNDTNYWGGTVGCLDANLIDSIDDIDLETTGSQHGRMWTSVGWSDHKHYSQDENGNWVIVSDIYDHDGDSNPDNNSCNSFHIAAHAADGVKIKPGCGE